MKRRKEAKNRAILDRTGTLDQATQPRMIRSPDSARAPVRMTGTALTVVLAAVPAGMLTEAPASVYRRLANGCLWFSLKRQVWHALVSVFVSFS